MCVQLLGERRAPCKAESQSSAQLPSRLASHLVRLTTRTIHATASPELGFLQETALPVNPVCYKWVTWGLFWGSRP